MDPCIIVHSVYAMYAHKHTQNENILNPNIAMQLSIIAVVLVVVGLVILFQHQRAYGLISMMAAWIFCCFKKTSSI